MTANNLTANWRQCLAERKAQRQETAQDEPNAVIDFGPGFALNPDGTVTPGQGLAMRVRRAPLSLWVQSGRVPQFLTAQAVRIMRGEAQDFDDSALSADEIEQALKFQVAAICYCALEPRIVAPGGGYVADSLSYTDLVEQFPEEAKSIYAWILAGSPGVPVATTDGGATDLNAVSNFPQSAKRPAGSRPRTRRPRQK